MPSTPPPDEMLAADGRAAMLFQFEGRSQAIVPMSHTPFACTTSWIVRPYAHALRVQQVGVSASAMIGVRFAPGGWAAFQHAIPIGDDSYPLNILSDFFTPPNIRALEGRLYDTLYTPRWAAPLIDYFTRYLHPPLYADLIAHAVRILERCETSIPALAHQVNLSERQFTRVFRDLVGLPPKQFARIARMRRVLYQPQRADNLLTLQQIARHHGYHDDAHLAHEFRHLVGMSPSQYFTGVHALIAQENPNDDRFLQLEDNTMIVSSEP